jgi:myosin heavy subunit
VSVGWCSWGCGSLTVEDTKNTILQSELRVLLNAKEATAAAKAGRQASSVTIVSKFKPQLGHLMENVSKTRKRYIHCVKPNKEKVFKMFVDHLRCDGIAAVITMTRVAFPNRLPHETVLEQIRFFGG